jgi:hypothetical protein
MSRERRTLLWNQTPRTGGTGPPSSANRTSCASLRHAYAGDRDRTRCHPLRRDGPRSSYRRLMARAYRYPAPHVCMFALPRLAETRMFRKIRPVKIFSHWNWSHALSVASFVNSALWLENPDSLGMIFRQILISRLIRKRVIAVQNLGVSQRRLGALGPSRVPTGLFFLKPGYKPKSSGARLGVKATGGGCTPRGSRPDSPPPHI